MSGRGAVGGGHGVPVSTTVGDGADRPVGHPHPQPRSRRRLAGRTQHGQRHARVVARRHPLHDRVAPGQRRGRTQRRQPRGEVRHVRAAPVQPALDARPRRVAQPLDLDVPRLQAAQRIGEHRAVPQRREQPLLAVHPAGQRPPGPVAQPGHPRGLLPRGPAPGGGRPRSVSSSAGPRRGRPAACRARARWRRRPASGTRRRRGTASRRRTAAGPRRCRRRGRGR